MFIIALFTIAKLWKQLRCPTSDQENKAYLHNGILLYHNNDMWFEGNWMKLEDIMLCEVRKKDKDHMISFMQGR
jgi:hypothetical protein